MSELAPDERKALQVARAAFEESENYGASWDDFIFTAGRDCEREQAAAELDRLTAEVAGLRVVLQMIVDSDDKGTAESFERMYYTAVDAARAALAAQEPTAQEQK